MSAASNPRASVRERIGVRAARAIERRDGYRCIYCSQDLSRGGVQFDHLTPRNGYTPRPDLDVPTNLGTCCARCNRAKSNMTLAQWTAYAATKLGLTISARAVRAQARRKLAA